MINDGLDRWLPKETEEPTSIHRAIRYSVFAGGKRLRPLLVLASGEAVGGAQELLLPVACAIEMIHTYSLIHDDLPSLDNDDMRRGRPTSHKVFGEAIAILAGDALLTLAFQVLASFPIEEPLRHRKIDAIREIATAAGTPYGMIAGQVVDLESEGKQIDPETLDFIHATKTAALFSASVGSGAIIAGASPEEKAILSNYGRKIGLAFQIIDDLLDAEGHSEALRKTAGRDLQRRKATYPQIWGVGESKKKAAELIDAALEDLRPLASRADVLRAIAERIDRRIPNGGNSSG